MNLLLAKNQTQQAVCEVCAPKPPQQFTLIAHLLYYILPPVIYTPPPTVSFLIVNIQ